MICDFETLAYSNGVYILQCRCCTTRRFSRTGRLTRVCDGASAVAETIRADSIKILANIGICHGCHERPEGCWRAKEYGCMLQMQKAGRVAAESKDCPLKKLD